MPVSIERAPKYKKYRYVSSNDPATQTKKNYGLNTEGYEKCHIQVIPDSGENPTIDILWWSEEKGQFVQEHTAITKAGVGAATPFEFTVDCNGRILYAEVSGLTSLGVTIMASGFNRVDPT